MVQDLFFFNGRVFAPKTDVYTFITQGVYFEIYSGDNFIDIHSLYDEKKLTIFLSKGDYYDFGVYWTSLLDNNNIRIEWMYSDQK